MVVLQKHSCVRCFERKVKCDKISPCSHCLRQDVDCRYGTPKPSKRKRNNAAVSSDDCRERRPKVGHAQVDPASREVSWSYRPLEEKALARVIPHELHESNALWLSVSKDMRDSKYDQIDSESDPELDCSTDFVLAQHGTADSYIPHPDSETALRLWSLYKENVEPLTKMLHVPSMEVSVQDFISGQGSTTIEFELLLFAIYSAAVFSISDSSCLELFGEKRADMLSRFRSATKQLLIKNRFISSTDLTVLQALCLFLLGMRSVYDGRTMWVMVGLAVRIAQGMGLHIDGTFSGLSPFRTELQRRVWYFLKMFDSRSAEHDGKEKFLLYTDGPRDTKNPANVNDLDISPDMVILPPDSKKITDMSFCAIRVDVGNFYRNAIIRRAKQSTGAEQASDMKLSLDELEEYLRDKYTKYCTPTNKFHLMLAIMSTHAPDVMRFMSHHPKNWTTHDSVSESERMYVWNVSKSVMKGFAACHTNPLLAGYRWHMSYSFPWQALVHLLDCLQRGFPKDATDDVWQIIDEVYATHPHFLTEKRRPVHIAIGRLVLGAYRIAPRRGSQRGGGGGGGDLARDRVPDYINVLLSREEAKKERRTFDGTTLLDRTNEPVSLGVSTESEVRDTGLMSGDGILDEGYAWNDVNWEDWAELLSNWEKNLDHETT